jgi:hypothetical protein
MDIREVMAFGFKEFVTKDAAVELHEFGSNRTGWYRRFRFTFPNGYEVSVIRVPGSFGASEGLWELGIVLGYNYVDAVGGWMTPQEVHNKLKEVSEWTSAK